MKPEVYRLPHGRHIPANQVNVHHAVWLKRWYTTPLEKHYRTLGGLVIPMQTTEHKNLHANALIPPKPSNNLMSRIIDFDDENQTMSQLERFTAITNFVGDIALRSWSYEQADEAKRLQESFLEQDEYIRKGIAEPVWNVNPHQL